MSVTAASLTHFPSSRTITQNMDTLDYIVIDLGAMIPTPEEEAVQRAIKYGTPIGRREEYKIVPSISNEEGWERKLERGSRGIGRHR